MKVLVTGGAGYIGSLLSEFLLKEKFSVKVIDNFQYNQSSLNHLLYHPKFEVEKIDVRDEDIIFGTLNFQKNLEMEIFKEYL